MKRNRHTPELSIRKLRTAEQLLNQGQSVADVCLSLEMLFSSYHRWRSCAAGKSHRGETPQGTGAGKRSLQEAPS
jgi:transposase-like protein